MSDCKKKLLLVNDDGIRAPGMVALITALMETQLYDIRVVAPAEEQSAMSGAMTIHGTLEVEEHQFSQDGLENILGWAVYGTPVDCVKVALRVICLEGDWYPDLVLSGINKGNNAGLNPLVSGTVGAALAARSSGLNAIALSLDHPPTYVSGEPHDVDRWNYKLAAKMTLPIVEEVLKHNPIDGVVLNVNFPNVLTRNDIFGTLLTRQGYSGWDDYFREGEAVNGKRRLKIHGSVNLRDDGITYDTCALRKGYVAVTPLGIHFDPSHAKDYEKACCHLATWKIFDAK